MVFGSKRLAIVREVLSRVQSKASWVSGPRDRARDAARQPLTADGWRTNRVPSEGDIASTDRNDIAIETNEQKASSGCHANPMRAGGFSHRDVISAASTILLMSEILPVPIMKTSFWIQLHVQIYQAERVTSHRQRRPLELSWVPP